MAKSVRFDLYDLKLFALTAELGSISGAAKAMPLALSAASARIKALEERQGLPLLARKPRGVELTHAGQLLLEHALKLLNAASDAQQGMDALSGRGRAKVTVFSNTTGLSTRLPAQLGDFLNANPSIDLTFEQRSSRAVIQAIKNGEADIGVIDGDYTRQNLLSFLYQRNQLVIIANQLSDLASKTHCRFEEWLQYPLVGYEKESSLQQFLERMALLSHQSGNYRATAPNFNSVATLVAANVGVAIVPKPLADRYESAFGLKQVSLEESWADRSLYICTRAESNVNVPSLRLARFLAESSNESSQLE